LRSRKVPSIEAFANGRLENASRIDEAFVIRFIITRIRKQSLTKATESAFERNLGQVWNGAVGTIVNVRIGSRNAQSSVLPIEQVRNDDVCKRWSVSAIWLDAEVVVSEAAVGSSWSWWIKDITIATSIRFSSQTIRTNRAVIVELAVGWWRINALASTRKACVGSVRTRWIGGGCTIECMIVNSLTLRNSITWTISISLCIQQAIGSWSRTSDVDSTTVSKTRNDSVTVALIDVIIAQDTSDITGCADSTRQYDRTWRHSNSRNVLTRNACNNKCLEISISLGFKL
jgi:hypothetical protein